MQHLHFKPTKQTRHALQYFTGDRILVLFLTAPETALTVTVEVEFITSGLNLHRKHVGCHRCLWHCIYHFL